MAENENKSDGISPHLASPVGEVRWGLMSFNQSNLFLPLGKVRMGCTKIPPTLS